MHPSHETLKINELNNTKNDQLANQPGSIWTYFFPSEKGTHITKSDDCIKQIVTQKFGKLPTGPWIVAPVETDWITHNSVGGFPICFNGDVIEIMLRVGLIMIWYWH